VEQAKDYCPEMIVVPAGSFMMGSPPTERGRSPSETLHPVTIAKSFAVAKLELTFDQWDICVAYGDCAPGVNDRWGRGQQPLINVTWDKAQQYVACLSKSSGKPYRLLTEAEYEYAARAGTQTAYPWGDELGTNNANCVGCGSQWESRQTAPVGSFVANKFGLYDMVGNVWEWVEDCYGGYGIAPNDGSARTNEAGCNLHVLRGGSWVVRPNEIRSATRGGRVASGNQNSYNFGFRVGRTIIAP
jgi:formylglycine-generating enzyme required for sulfatase activity